MQQTSLCNEIYWLMGIALQGVIFRELLQEMSHGFIITPMKRSQSIHPSIYPAMTEVFKARQLLDSSMSWQAEVSVLFWYIEDVVMMEGLPNGTAVNGVVYCSILTRLCCLP
jgi:hypothetical protein